MRDEHYKFRYSGWLGGEPDQRKEAVLIPGNECFHFVRKQELQGWHYVEMNKLDGTTILVIEFKLAVKNANSGVNDTPTYTSSIFVRGSLPFGCHFQFFEVTNRKFFG